MKKLLFLAIIGSISCAAFAQQGQQDPSPQAFAEHKAREIAFLEAHLACVKAAPTPEALRACHDRRKQRP